MNNWFTHITLDEIHEYLKNNEEFVQIVTDKKNVFTKEHRISQELATFLSRLPVARYIKKNFSVEYIVQEKTYSTKGMYVTFFEI